MKYKYNYNMKPKKMDFKVIIIAVIIVFVSFIISLFVFKENRIISKINNAILKPFEWVSNLDISKKIKDGISTKNSLKLENERLQKENTDLSLSLIEYQKLLKENESLRKLLEIEGTFQHYNLASGRIILRSHDNYTKTFVVNIGYNDGVRENQAVIHKEGLVGYVASVTENTATIVTILDPKTSVSVVIPTVSTTAILSGNLEMKAKNNLRLESIQIGSEISIGDILYTSGLGNMYPQAIPTAKIINSESSKTDSERYAICEPLVDIAAINEVSIIIGEK